MFYGNNFWMNFTQKFRDFQRNLLRLYLPTKSQVEFHLKLPEFLKKILFIFSHPKEKRYNRAQNIVIIKIKRRKNQHNLNF